MNLITRILNYIVNWTCTCYDDKVNPYCSKHGDHHEINKLLGFNVYVNGERGEPW
jgi:hypothetical protein